MKLTIIIEEQYVESAREKAKEIFKDIPVLKIPASATGRNPATHWVCSLDVSEEGYQRLTALQEHSRMEKCSAAVLLNEMNLKLIK